MQNKKRRRRWLQRRSREQAATHGLWRPHGSGRDDWEVHFGAVAVAGELRLSITDCMAQFCLPCAEIAGKTFRLKFKSEAARDASTRVTAFDYVTGIDVPLDVMVAHLGETRAAESFRTGASSSQEDEAVLIDARKAAKLLGITVEALRMRQKRGQVRGIVKTGRRVQFHRIVLLESYERKARRR
jgi:hypothetical protein